MRRGRWDSGRKWDQGVQFFDRWVADAKTFAINTVAVIGDIAKRLAQTQTGAIPRQSVHNDNKFPKKS
jgi:hypothetical protein